MWINWHFYTASGNVNSCTPRVNLKQTKIFKTNMSDLTGNDVSTKLSSVKKIRI